MVYELYNQKVVSFTILRPSLGFCIIKKNELHGLFGQHSYNAKRVVPRTSMLNMEVKTTEAMHGV